MIATEELVVTKKLKIKFATKRIEVERGTDSGQNISHVKEWNHDSSLKEQSRHGISTQHKLMARSNYAGKVFVADHVKVKLSMTGANKRGPSGALEDHNQKRRKMDRSVTQQCSRILKRLMTHPAGWVFNQPVDPVKLNIPDYFSVISEPMDLGTIKSKLEKNLYYGPGEFVADVRLTFSNAMLYNPASNNVHLMAKQLNEVFSTSWKSLDVKWNHESLEADQGQVLNRRARKTNVTKLNCQKTPSLHTASLLKRSMSFEDRQTLRNELSTVLSGEIPPHLHGTFQKFGLTCQNEERFVLDIDTLDDKSLLELRKVTRSFIEARAAEVKLAKAAENCGGESLKKNFHKGTDSVNRHSCTPADSELPLCPASHKCGLCGNVTCQCRVDNNSIHESTSDLSSDRSLSRDYSADRGDAPKLIARQEKHQCHEPANSSESSKSEPDSDGGVSAVDDENLCPSSHFSTPATVATSGEEWRTPVIDIQLSPKRALRAALLKSRFADTILKAQHRTLLDHGDKADPVKMQQEKERLEKKQREEKARIETEIRAAEAAARMRAEVELKMQREKEREAARVALQKMEKTVEIDENLQILKDLELLSGCSLSDHHLDAEVGEEILSTLFLSPRLGNPLERLGLFMKDEYLRDEEDEDVILNGSGEEGEIIS